MDISKNIKELTRLVDPKKSLRTAWIIESGLYFALVFIVLIWIPDRISGLVQVSPYLFGLIVGQGAAGWSGSNVKRYTESLIIKAKNGGSRGDQEAA
jgi:hypothetical protein